jgi:hypothetical protein
MKVERVLVIVLALALAFTLGVQLSQAQVYAPGGKVEARGMNLPAATLDDKIMIQGRLTDASGNPLTGNYSITASIYDVSSGGTARCSETATISVSNGLFNMGLDTCTTSDINGDQLYLVQLGINHSVVTTVRICLFYRMICQFKPPMDFRHDVLHVLRHPFFESRRVYGQGNKHFHLDFRTLP